MSAADLALPVSPTLRIRLPLMVMTLCLLWASAFSVAKLAMADCPPLLLLAVRFLLAGVLMVGAAPIFGVPLKLAWRDLLLFAVLGLANQAAYLGIGYFGLRSISSGLSALIISANPVLTAVLAALFLGERITWSNAAGLVLSLGGVAFVVQSRHLVGMEDPIGVGLTIASLTSLVVGTILFKRFAPTEGLWVGNAIQNLSAGLVLLPLAFSLESTATVVPSWRLFATVAYLIVFVSVCANWLWFRVLAVSGATAASSYHFTMPPLGLLFGALLLGEHLRLTDFAGIVPVALGIYLVTHSKSSHGKSTRCSGQ